MTSRDVVAESVVRPARPAAPAGEVEGPGWIRLVEQARQGDNEAFELLLEGRIARLLRLAMSIMGNDADALDAVQNSCIHAWLELPRLRDASRFDAWLWRIVINTCRSSIRGRRRVAVREIGMDDPSPGLATGAGDPTPGDRASDRDLVARAFRRLGVDHRTILVLHHVEDRSVRDIAELLGISDGTVKSRLHSARRSLERALVLERR